MAHNLKGKTVIPFCTHGGSGQSGTYKKIQKLRSGADALTGFAVSDEDIKTKAAQKKLRAWMSLAAGNITGKWQKRTGRQNKAKGNWRL